MASFLILGCGYTGMRVAAELHAAGHSVLCTRRHEVATKDESLLWTPCDVADDRSVASLVAKLEPRMSVLYSVPAVGRVPSSLLSALGSLKPRRLIYLSTTGVYGAVAMVNADTIPNPESERDLERYETEQLIAKQIAGALILRPAAIYGPHRGIHVAARNGVFRPPPGGNRVVSRIHVDDLVKHVLAGFESDVAGAFPVADEEPCTSLKLAEWTCSYLHLPPPAFEQRQEEESRRGHKEGRRVDGSRIRQLLQLPLQFATFREGVANCLRVEDS